MNQLDQLPVPQVDKLVKLDMEYKERTMPIEQELHLKQTMLLTWSLHCKGENE
jgi:hypothetical protein